MVNVPPYLVVPFLIRLSFIKFGKFNVYMRFACQLLASGTHRIAELKVYYPGEGRLIDLYREIGRRFARRSLKKASFAYRLFILLIFAAIFLSPSVARAVDTDIEQDVQKSLTQSRSLVEQIKTKLSQGASITSEATHLKKIAENIKASNLLLVDRFKAREEKAKALGSAALSRQQAMTANYKAALTEYLSIIDGLPPDNSLSSSTIKTLQSFFERILPQKKRPIIGSLPYKHLNLSSQTPTTAPSITPAYLGGNKIVSPDDTMASPEAPISPEIATLAQSLNWNPVSIYEYVKNNIDTEWYWGCMKGAEETLHQKSGNDCDQASLLTALLRASGFPTRYVRGVIQFFPDINTAKNLTGIDSPIKIAEFFQKAGIPYTPLVAGGTISNFQIEHVWVESQIPYSNYRGAVIDANGKAWFGLDTSIKVKGYIYNNVPDILSAMSLSTVRDQYLSLSTSTSGTAQPAPVPTPLEYLQQYINVQLASSASTSTYSDYLRTRTLIPEVLNIIPASMQFTQVKTTNEYELIPDELIHKVKFTAIDPNNNVLFNITLPLYTLSNQSIAMSYEPESVADQEIIDSFGGLNNTPTYLVRLRPMLKVNGGRTIIAQGGLPMGADYNLTIELDGIGGVQETVTSAQVVGNLTSIGIAAQNAYSSPTSSTGQQDAEQQLHLEAVHYIDRWNKAEDELASLLHLSIARPVPTVVTMGGVIDVSYLLNVPNGFTWKGVFVDAGLRAIETVSTSSDAGESGDRQKIFMKLSSLQGSVLENRVFEDDFQVGAISTAKLFQIESQGAGVAGTGTGLLTIDSTNINTVLPGLPVDDSVKTDISNAVNQNLVVRIPQSEINYEDWTGIGYIKENPDTGESGWMLSGMIAGGMTAWDVSRWSDAIAGILQGTYSEPPNYDTASAQYIQKITATDMQNGIVGTQLSQPLQVKVTDADHNPVAGAAVTFTVKAGNGTFGNNATSLVVNTNYLGIASTNVTLGKYTKDNPAFVWDTGYTYSMQVGENIINASLPSGTSLTTPFTALGFPKAPDHMTQTYGNGTYGVVLNFAGFISVDIEDAFNNPISNAAVQFASVPVANPSCSADTTKNYASLVSTDAACLNQSPVWGDCGNPVSAMTVTTSNTGAAS